MSENKRPPWDGHSALAELGSIPHSAFGLSRMSRPSGLLGLALFGHLLETNSLTMPPLGPFQNLPSWQKHANGLTALAPSMTDSQLATVQISKPVFMKTEKI